MAETAVATSAQPAAAPRKPRLSLLRIIEMNVGFFGLQFSFGLQQGNMVPIYSWLGRGIAFPRRNPRRNLARHPRDAAGDAPDGKNELSGSEFALVNWSAPEQIADGDIDHYVEVTAAQGIPGMIKGFRDPAHFVDPADGQTYLLFTGSLEHPPSAWNGCIGLLRADRATGAWEVLPPLLSADGFDNWWVTSTLSVHGFVDYPGIAADERQDDAAWRQHTFGGVPAPVFTLALDGDSARIADAAAA